MVELSDRSLLQQASDNLRRRATLDQERTEADQMIPHLKTQIATLIADRIPCPEILEVVIRKPSDHFKFSQAPQNYATFNPSSTETYDTQLVLTVPIESGSTHVTVFSSAYPEDTEMAQSLTYRIDVEHLDHVLIITKTEAVLESKKRVLPCESLTSYQLSQPEWRHPVTLDDVKQYQGLIEELIARQDIVTFRRSTQPQITKEDYSQIIVKRN